MTTGILGDDEGLLTEQDAVELLQVSLSRLRLGQIPRFAADLSADRSGGGADEQWRSGP
jgi:hypothetical protein